MIDTIIPIRVIPRERSTLLPVTLMLLAQAAIWFVAGIEFIRLNSPLLTNY